MASANAAGRAIELGYKNVNVFRDGLPAWVAAGYPVHSIEKLPKVEVPSITTKDLKTIMDKREDFVLLDIRFKSLLKKYKLNAEHLINVPLDMLSDRHTEIPRGKKIIVIDEVGKRVKIAGRYLVSKGYNDVSIVEGGIQKWIVDGHPVTKQDD